MIQSSLFEQFESLNVAGVRHAFTRRVADIDVAHDKAEALRRLDKVHREIRTELGSGEWPLLTAEQIHADKIAVIDDRVGADHEYAGCDGLVTNQRHCVLGICVADCGAVYIVDPQTRAIGLVHSGKKGTELAIVSKAIGQMRERFGSDPANLIVQLSPCIRPPHYEIDFAANIVEQACSLGVQQVHDCGICTACDLDSYYSYRAEKGKTGRMLALLALE
jgi:copper oxidase (laccase) domain-containing protein